MKGPLLAGLVEAEVAVLGELGGAGEPAADVPVVLVALLFEVAGEFRRALSALANLAGILDATRFRSFLQHPEVNLDLDPVPAAHVDLLTHPDTGTERQDKRQDQGDDADSA